MTADRAATVSRLGFARMLYALDMPLAPLGVPAGVPPLGASATVGVFWAVFGWAVMSEAGRAAPAAGSMIRAGSPSPAWTDPTAR